MLLKSLVKPFHNFRIWFILIIIYYLFSPTAYAVASLVKHSHNETFTDNFFESELRTKYGSIIKDKLHLGEYLILFQKEEIYWIKKK